MRRLLAPRSMAAATVGVLVLLAAGGGYALASGSSKTIHACVHHRGGGIYIAKKCARHDKKISWNRVGPRGATGATGPEGPQGPGATDLVYNTAGGSSATQPTIGTIGPWSVSFTCAQSGSTTTATPYFTGPAGSVDGIAAGTTSALSVSESFAQLSNQILTTISSDSTVTSSESFEALFEPSSGTSYEVTATTAATGGTTDTCHFAATATRVSSTASAAVSARAKPATTGALVRSGAEPLIRVR